MKLFKISQSERGGYDTYDSAVVAAETEEEAALTYPGIESDKPITEWDKYSGWASSPANVYVEYLGEASDGIERGVIVSSFNAG